MALGPAIVFAPLHLENLDFAGLSLGNHGGGYRCVKIRAADGHVLTVRNHEYPAQVDGFTFLGGNFFDFQLVANSDPILLAAGFNYCVHVFAQVLNYVVIRAGLRGGKRGIFLPLPEIHSLAVGMLKRTRDFIRQPGCSQTNFPPEFKLKLRNFQH